VLAAEDQHHELRDNLPLVGRQAEWRALQRHSGEFLVELAGREKARTNIPTLKVEYNRVHGFYIEVSRSYAENVPDDYRRRQTLKNAERFITPELKQFEDKALSAQERALAREKLLWDALLDELALHVDALAALGRALAGFDAALNFFAQGLKQAGLADPSKAFGISIDADLANTEMIRSGGFQAASAGVPMDRVGYGLIDDLNRIYNNQPPVDQGVAVKIINQQNAPQSGSWDGDFDATPDYLKLWGKS